MLTILYEFGNTKPVRLCSQVICNKASPVRRPADNEVGQPAFFRVGAEEAFPLLLAANQGMAVSAAEEEEEAPLRRS